MATVRQIVGGGLVKDPADGKTRQVAGAGTVTNSPAAAPAGTPYAYGQIII